MRAARLLVVVFVTALPILSWAHGGRGGLDTYGCHLDRKRSTYHCHKGPFAGEQFPTLQVMLKRVQALENQSRSGTAKGAEAQPGEEAQEVCIIEKETKKIMCGEPVRSRRLHEGSGTAD